MRYLQVSEQGKFVVKWIGGTLIGLILAPLAGFIIIIALSEIVIQLLPRDSLSNPRTNLLLNGVSLFALVIAIVIMGASIGLAQWDMALKDKIRKRSWIAVNSIIVFVAYFSLIVWNELFPDIITVTGPSQVSGFVNPAKVSDTWMLGITTLGLIVGSAVGLPQWLVLRRYVHQAERWMIANIAGVIAAIMTFVVLVHIWQDYLLPLFVAYCCTGPIAFGAITGLVLFNLLKHGKRTSE